MKSTILPINVKFKKIIGVDVNQTSPSLIAKQLIIFGGLIQDVKV